MHMCFFLNKPTELRRAERQDAPDQQRVLPGPLYPLRLPSPLQWLGLTKWQKKNWGFNSSQSQVTLCQWRETWSDISMFFTLLLTNFLLVASFTQIVAMVGLSNIPLIAAINGFIFSLNHGQASSSGEPLPPPPFLPRPHHRPDHRHQGARHSGSIVSTRDNVVFPSSLWYPIWPFCVTSYSCCSWIIVDILYSKRIVPSICNPASASTICKLSFSTAFSSCSSASSPWRRLRDRRRPKLELEPCTRSRLRQLSIISFWFDRHNEILLVWSRILFVYLKIRLRWLICIGGGGSLELDMYIWIVQLYRISDDSQTVPSG